MHSRIFQLETDVDNAIDSPLTEDDIIGDWESPGWFTTTIADYVSDATDREEDIKWFIDCLDKAKDYIKVETIYDATEKKTMYDSITFLKGFKEQYFKKRHEIFKDKVKEMTQKDFCDPIYVYRLKALLEDKFGFYIYGNDNGLYNLDAFVRDSLIEDTTYYFGSTLDYHY